MTQCRLSGFSGMTQCRLSGFSGMTQCRPSGFSGMTPFEGYCRTKSDLCQENSSGLLRPRNDTGPAITMTLWESLFWQGGHYEYHYEKGHGFNDAENHNVIAKTFAGFA